MQTISPSPIYHQPVYYPSPVHEYHVQAWRATLFINGFCLLVLFCLNVAYTAWRHDRFGTMLGVVEVVFTVWAVFVRQSIRLVVSPEGITYRRSGSTLFVAWEDMIGIGPPPRWGFGVIGGIVTRHAAWQHPRWKLWARRDPFIPLRTTRGRYWQQGVGDELAYYAPWLYDAMPIEWRTYHHPLL